MHKEHFKKVQRILCYLDLGKPSHLVIEYAHLMAQQLDAELYVLHTVTDIGRAAGFYVPHMNTDKIEQEMVKAAQDKLYAVCSQSVGDIIDHAHRLVRRGDVMEVIDDYLQSLDIDLLVVGHEVAALSLFRDDYATKYLKNPLCPVLIVPLTGE